MSQTLRLHKNQEEKIVLDKIKQLVETFETTEFSINEIEFVGGTQRTSVFEGVFWRNKKAFVETMNSLRQRGIVSFNGEILLVKNDLYYANPQFRFKIIPENIGDLKPFQTPIDIFENMTKYLKNTLNENFLTVKEHLINAEKSLSIKNKNDYSDVGHFCQLAYEDFLESCCRELEIDISDIKSRSHTNEKFKRILERFKKLKKDNKSINLLEALGHFRGCSSDFNEKIEHRETKNNSTFSEAERGFIYTYLIIKEINNFVEKMLNV